MPVAVSRRTAALWTALVFVTGCAAPDALPPRAANERGAVVFDTVFDSARAACWVVPACGRPLPGPYYYVSYADSWRIPYWVLYYVARHRLTGTVRRLHDFRPDSSLPTELRVRPEDYRGTGFDRGHLAPAADFSFDSVAMAATFLMSNMSPQPPGTNRGTWRRVEERVRSAVGRFGQGWVITGNVFIDDDSNRVAPAEWLRRDGQRWVAVPTHLFKAVLLRDSAENYALLGFLVPNRAGSASAPVEEYLVPVRRLEEIAGWDFFPFLPDRLEESLEMQFGTAR